MSQQTIKQRARRTAREMAERRRRERADRERRFADLAEQAMVALGERDVAVAAAERRAGEALREMTEQEGLSLRDAVQWCGDTLSSREAARLRRLAVTPPVELGKQAGLHLCQPAGEGVGAQEWIE